VKFKKSSQRVEVEQEIDQQDSRDQEGPNQRLGHKRNAAPGTGPHAKASKLDSMASQSLLASSSRMHPVREADALCSGKGWQLYQLN
jgi:hypothetical protein